MFDLFLCVFSGVFLIISGFAVFLRSLLHPYNFIITNNHLSQSRLTKLVFNKRIEYSSFWLFLLFSLTSSILTFNPDIELIHSNITLNSLIIIPIILQITMTSYNGSDTPSIGSNMNSDMNIATSMDSSINNTNSMNSMNSSINSIHGVCLVLAGLLIGSDSDSDSSSFYDLTSLSILSFLLIGTGFCSVIHSILLSAIELMVIKAEFISPFLNSLISTVSRFSSLLLLLTGVYLINLAISTREGIQHSDDESHLLYLQLSFFFLGLLTVTAITEILIRYQQQQWPINITLHAK